MVEKITIVPSKVRGLGNILNPRAIDEYENYNSSLVVEDVDIEDFPYDSAFKICHEVLFNPPLDGTDEIVSWTQLVNKTEDGVFTSHGSYLDGGWDNSGLWRLEFDIAYTPSLYWTYIGLLICPVGMDEYDDSQICATTWEGKSTPVWRGSTLVNGPSSYNYSNPTEYHHYVIKKIADNLLKIEFDGNIWVYQCDTLNNYNRLTIGSRDNPANRNTGASILLKDITVWAWYNED